MGCVDGVYGDCRCPTSCGITDGRAVTCACEVPGLPTEGTRTCILDGVWDRCSCEEEPTACGAGQRSRCACGGGGIGEAVCGADGVWEGCVCSPFDAGVPDGCVPSTCEDLGARCGDIVDGCGTVRDCGPCGMDVRSLVLSANEMVWDPTREVLLVAAAIRVGDPGSVIRAIDPATLDTAFEVAVDGDPDHLALGDDGRSLWVTIDADFRHELLRVDLESQTVTAEIGLPYTPTGDALEARDLVALPGSSNVVVAVTDDFADERLLVYEEALLRAELADLLDYPAESLLVASPTTVIGFGFGYLTAYRLMDDEILATRVVEEPLPDGQVVYESERIFCEQGWVVDANTFEDLESVGASGTVAVEAGGGRVYYLEWNDDGALDLVVGDPAESVRLSSQALGTPPNLRTSSLVRWGDRGLAFLGTTATSREALPDTLFVVTSDAIGVSRP